ncbi:MAG: hypothetical protein L3J78_04905 [Thermoplasmata archaeon]|nr:hypothetical protein [Thermoplasmata archaeon]
MFETLSLLVPAAAALLALPFTRLRAPADAQVRAAYLFHASGDPLATIASDELPPVAPSELEPILGSVRGFVESAVPGSRGFTVTSTRFGEESLVAVRGRYVSACAVFRGRGDSAVRRDLVRVVQTFESSNEEQLGTWEDAIQLADVASEALSSLMTSSGTDLAA